MIEKLNSTVISALKACTSTPTDWVDCLQSVAMSIRSQPHESTGISPYEMMFGVPMRLPTELEDSDIPKNVTPDELSKIMPHPPNGQDDKGIFESVDAVWQIIHNSASGNISRAKAKQSFYFEQRHRGVPLEIGDKILHYNRRAGQRLGDKLEGRWLGLYTIIGKKAKNKYQVKDMKGYVLKTYLNGSNLKCYLTKDDVNDSNPDLVPVSELPDNPDTVDDLLASIKFEKNRPKSKGGKKRKTSDVDLLFPDPQGYKRKKTKPSKQLTTSPSSPPAQPIGDQSDIVIPPSQTEKKWAQKNVKLITSSQEHVKQNQDTMKLKKNTFFQKMISESNKFANQLSKGDNKHNTHDNNNNDNITILNIDDTPSYIFNPLSIPQRKVICNRTGLIYRKDELNFSNQGENMGTRAPKVRSIKGDGNCFFRAMSVGLTGWEVGHLKIRQQVCDHLITYGLYTCQVEGKFYVNQNKMKHHGTYATDIEIMAAAQIFGVDIYVYHTYGGKLRWLRFPCKHSSGSASSNAIYFDNRYGNGKTGHFDFVIGIF